MTKLENNLNGTKRSSLQSLYLHGYLLCKYERNTLSPRMVELGGLLEVMVRAASGWRAHQHELNLLVCRILEGSGELGILKSSHQR